MKILYITFRFPYPETDGLKLKLLNIARQLSRKHTVDLVALNDGPLVSTDDPEHLFNNVKVFPFSKLRGALNSLRFLFNDKPMQVNYFYFKKVKDYIDSVAKNYDLVLCEHVRTAEYARDLPIPKFLDFMDAQSLHYEEAIAKSSGLWHWIYKIELNRLKRYERQMMETFNKTFVVSPYDSQYLGGRPIVIQNGVRTELLKRKFEDQEEDWIVFLGKMDYNPNVDAVKYFVKEVLPLIPNVKFCIVGISPSKEVLGLQSDRVIVTGFVDDPYQYMEKAKVVVAPIRFSGGIQNKVLEAMALGKPVVTTTNCARSISNELVVADDPKEMAQRINELLQDDQKRKTLGKRYRQIVAQNFTWEKFGDKLLREMGA
jgi:glycosyltransferase involved in cell wall biosynthesis